MQNIPYDTGKPNRTKSLLIRIKGVVGDQGASAANAKYECCPIEEQEHSLQSLNLEDVAIEKIALVIGEYLPDESSGFVANGVKLKQPDAFDPETDNYHQTQERSAILVATIKDENKFYFYSEFLQNVTEDVDGIFAACQQGTIIPNSTALQKKTFNDLIFLGDPVKWLISRVQLGIAADSVKIFQLLLNGQLDDEEDAEDLELWDHDCPTQAVLALSQSIGDNALQGMVIDVCLSRALIYQFCESYKLLEEAGIVDVDYRKLARRAYELAQRVVGNPLPVPDDASFDATEYSAARFLDLFIDIKRETLKAVDDLMKCNGERMPDVTLPDADMTKLLSNAMEAGDHHKRMDAIKNILALAMIEHESSLELIQKLDGQELDAMIKMRDALGDCDEDEDDQ
ncbi:hypothetical protein FG05_00928 [Fusarium graminearum]|nr:hypothetical protein FG05_00928 [Fusarium graminearum]